MDVDFVRKSVRAIGRCAIKVDTAAERCVSTLVDLIQTKVTYVVQEAVIVIKVSCWVCLPLLAATYLTLDAQYSLVSASLLCTNLTKRLPTGYFSIRTNKFVSGLVGHLPKVPQPVREYHLHFV